MDKHPWSLDEMEYMRGHYPEQGGLPVAVALDRPIGSVRSKAFKMGLIYAPTALGSAGLKHCSGCDTVLPFEAFSRNVKQVDGFSNWCKQCHKAKVARKRQEDPAYYPAILRKKREKLRSEVLSAYGGDHPKCVCCGEDERMFLAVDHINGGGNAHRRTIGTRSFYDWLKGNDFPPEFQLLCHNCNVAKAFYGSCPHHRAQR